MEDQIKTWGWDITAEQLYETQQKRKYFEELEQRLMEELKKLSHHKTHVGEKFILMAAARKGSIDYKSIPQLYSVNLDRYRKEDIIMWKLVKQ